MKKKTNNFFSYRNPFFRKIIKWVWVSLLSFIIVLLLFLSAVKYDLFGFFGGMPELTEIENPENDLSSELISTDGVSIGRYFVFNRSYVEYEQLPEDLVKTLIYSEDHRFLSHSGIDFIGLVRAVYGFITLNPEQGGGSTITQQLAKNLFTINKEQNLDGPIANYGVTINRIVQKIKESIISIRLEQTFTKQEILTLYLNTTSFNYNANGIKVASEIYFDKPVSRLNIQECALLVGMLQNPVLFNPRNHRERAQSKRNEVLQKLWRRDYISKQEFDSLKVLPIELQFKIQNHNEGMATYFRSVILPDLQKWCTINGYNVRNSGLKIYTTLDSRMQIHAENAVAEYMKTLQTDFQIQARVSGPWLDNNNLEIKGFIESRIKQTDQYRSLEKKYGNQSDSIYYYLNLKKHMKVFTWDGEKDTIFNVVDSLNYYKRFLNTGFLSMDAKTGAIKAWVGGISHKYFKFDHVKQSKRQPGSTFKPFIYGLAIENGYTSCFEMKDISPSFKLNDGKMWTPANSNGTLGSGKTMTIREALALSKNSITAQLLKELGVTNVIDFAKRLGVTSKLDPVPSLCLGTNEVSLFEMVGAYGPFVNQGIYIEPHYITRIEDKHGNVIESFVPHSRQAINEETAFHMIHMLMGGVEIEGGTSWSISQKIKSDNEIGGKTGTTNNGSDGWYMGVTKDLVTGVWVGGDEPVIRYKNWALGSGVRTARPIWEKYMLKIYADKTIPYKKGSFIRPADGLPSTLDCDKHYIASSDEIPEIEKSLSVDDTN